MTDDIETVISILDLERLEDNLFRGRGPQGGWQRVFGGQVVGQALMAATHTVEERGVHSLHAYFLRPGDPSVPIVYDVERIRDGGSFTTRRVVAIQHGRPIFSMSCSFQVAEEGLTHQTITMPDVPEPESLADQQEVAKTMMERAPEGVRRYWSRKRPIEIRPVDIGLYLHRDRVEPVHYLWVRVVEPLPDNARLHAPALAYLSDLTLLDSALVAHGRSVFDLDMQAASLDHAMWFHRPCRPDEWLLYAEESPSASGARGFTRGSLFSRDGQLVASVAQEGLIRVRPEGSRPIIT